MMINFSAGRLRVSLFISLAIASLVTFGQNDPGQGARFTTWYQDRPGAISISFDDAGYTQYASAFPILGKYNIKATFSIVGEWIGEEPGYTAEPGYFEIRRMGWIQMLELFAHGHELAAHGYLHAKYDKHMPVSELAGEMEQIRLLIESRTNSRVYTLNYPYSFASGNIPLAAQEAGYLFGRTGMDTINSAIPSNMFLLASQPILNSENPDSVKFLGWIDQTEGNWMILMYHHLFPLDSREMGIIREHQVEYSYSIPPEKFENQVEALASSGYWIAPVYCVGKYIAERENTEINVCRYDGQVIINTVTSLDTAVYNQPLTMEIDLSWKKVKVQGSLEDGIFEIRNDKLFIDVLPETEIILTKE